MLALTAVAALGLVFVAASRLQPARPVAYIYTPTCNCSWQTAGQGWPRGTERDGFFIRQVRSPDDILRGLLVFKDKLA